MTELPRALRGGLLDRMAAPRSFRRGLAWPLVVGGVAVACGSSSDLNVTQAGSGGSGKAGFGPVATGGAATATGGVAAWSGGRAPTGGACSGDCWSGNCCSTPNSTCVNGNVECRCQGGVWTSCISLSQTGGTATGGISTGGTASGGKATGGTATGGTAPVPLCDTVVSLPAMGTACSTPGESQCDASGNRCICERGIWYCNNVCPASQPTPSEACQRGAVCNYPAGVTCACVNSLWMCIGGDICPSNVPTTGAACNNLTGVVCDYPGSVHLACVCMANADAGSGSTWTCIQSGACPATQPAYDLAANCSSTAGCTYSTSPYHCLCFQAGTPWVCF